MINLHLSHTPKGNILNVISKKDDGTENKIGECAVRIIEESEVDSIVKEGFVPMHIVENDEDKICAISTEALSKIGITQNVLRTIEGDTGEAVKELLKEAILEKYEIKEKCGVEIEGSDYENARLDESEFYGLIKTIQDGNVRCLTNINKIVKLAFHAMQRTIQTIGCAKEFKLTDKMNIIFMPQATVMESSEPFAKGTFKLARKAHNLFLRDDLRATLTFELKTEIEKKQMKEFMRTHNMSVLKEHSLYELRLMSELKDVPGIVSTLSFVYMDSEHVKIAQPLFEGSFTKLMTLQNPDLKKLFKGVLLGLKELHERNICHNDIKPSNMLWKDQEGVISDLGLACKIGEEEPSGGTPFFYAPERLSKIYRKPPGLQSDVWAMGLSLYKMFNMGQNPSLSIIKAGEFYKQIFDVNEKYLEMKDTLAKIEDTLVGDLDAGQEESVEIKALEKEIKNLKIEKRRASEELEFYFKRIYDVEAPHKTAAVYLEAYPEPREPLEHLIWECLRPDPDDRPTAEELYGRYMELVG